MTDRRIAGEPPPLGAGLAAKIGGLRAQRIEAELQIEHLGEMTDAALKGRIAELDRTLSHVRNAAAMKAAPAAEFAKAAALAEREFVAKHLRTALSDLRSGDTASTAEMLERLLEALAKIDHNIKD